MIVETGRDQAGQGLNKTEQEKDSELEELRADRSEGEGSAELATEVVSPSGVKMKVVLCI